MKNENKTFFSLYNSEKELVLLGLSSDTKFAIIKVNLNPEKKIKIKYFEISFFFSDKISIITMS